MDKRVSSAPLGTAAAPAGCLVVSFLSRTHSDEGWPGLRESSAQRGRAPPGPPPPNADTEAWRGFYPESTCCQGGSSRKRKGRRAGLMPLPTEASGLRSPRGRDRRCNRARCGRPAWPRGSHSFRHRVWREDLNVAIEPRRRARQQLPSGKAPGPRQRALRASRRQHRGREPGWAGHAVKVSVGPSPWGVPPVPREKAELGGCHQARLPGPGRDGDFLWLHLRKRL